MSTATVKLEKGHCTVHLPPEISVPEGEVSVRLDGKTLVLEPLKKEHWPANFFEAIHISDAAFVRPPQPPMPPIKPVSDQRE
jgi:virulence-associated protein VagC